MPAMAAGEERPRTSFLAVGWAYALLATMWGAWILWIAEWYFKPLSWWDWPKKIGRSGYLDWADGYWVFMVVPQLLVTVLAYLYLKIDRRQFPNRSLPGGKAPARWARTVVVAQRSLGVLSLSELFWIAVTVALLTWYIGRTTWKSWRVLERPPAHSGHMHGAVDMSLKMWQKKIDKFCHNFGWGSSILLFVMFFPVSRSSPLLRATGIPYEKALTYHRWMAHGMLFLGSVHGVGYWILWLLEGKFDENVSLWQEHGINYLAGEICLIAGFVIWVTSIGPVRRRMFEFFVRTHQIVYLIFIVFFMMHLFDLWLHVMFPSILLYGIDRILRIAQGMHLVQAQSVAILKDGSVELTLPIAEDVAYKALDSVFVNVPLLSQAQWHPFSVCSSPLDGRRSLRLVVRPSGHWSCALRRLAAAKEPLLLRVEGPYGQEQDYFAKYDSLVLIAGGSGISPLMSLLRDLLHRCHNRQQRLPSSITLVWSVKTSSSLHLLEGIQAASICPDYDQFVNVNIDLYVTEEASAGEEQGKPLLEMTRQTWKPMYPMVPQVAAGRDLASLLVYMFIGGGTFSSIVVFSRFLVGPIDGQSFAVIPLWVRSLIYIAAFLLGLFVFAGIAVGGWYLIRPLLLRRDTSNDVKLGDATTELIERESSIPKGETLSFLQQPSITYGSRPNIADVLSKVMENSMVRDVGVLVCGPYGMEVDVAEQCRRRSAGPLSLPFSCGKRPVLNFHSLSFTM